MSSVQLEHTLLLVGGQLDDGGTLSDAILQYNHETEGWVTRTEKLGTGRVFAGATMVPDSVVDCV